MSPVPMSEQAVGAGIACSLVRAWCAWKRPDAAAGEAGSIFVGPGGAPAPYPVRRTERGSHPRRWHGAAAAVSSALPPCLQHSQGQQRSPFSGR